MAPSAEAPAPVFAPDSPWSTAIREDPVLDWNSEGMVAALTEGGGAHALLYQYGVPVYEADASTPRVAVTCTRQDWGQCPLQQQPVPVPWTASPSPGSDGAMVVIDRADGRVYDFWQARPARAGAWTVSWGTWAWLGSDGIGGEAGGATGGATGAGINLLAGLVRLSEIRAGQIDHALAIVSSASCRDVFRYPATKTDGRDSGAACVPQGARIQLDPSIDVARIKGITPGEIAVARALQTYGGYVRDTGGTSLGVAFESPRGVDPYPEIAGFPWDYYGMPHIPWDRLRVLSQWNGG